MKILIQNIIDEFKLLVVIGDLHTHWEEISDFIIKYGITNCCFLQVGDFGIGLVKNQEGLLRELNDFLKQTNNVLYVNRGNHDDPKYFKEEYLEKYSHIKFLPDFTLLDINLLDQESNTYNPKRILNIGGAISIDRTKNVLGIDYFGIDEEIQFDNIPTELLAENHYIDIIISHTAPLNVAPITGKVLTSDILDQDINLMNEIYQERENLGKTIKEISKPNPFIDKLRCYYGHFHSSSITELEGVEFSLLNINEFKEVKI